MRTTVSIDDHLLERAKERAARDRSTLGRVVEESLRSFLAEPTQAGPPDEDFDLPTSHRVGGFSAGVDPTSNASLLDAADR